MIYLDHSSTSPLLPEVKPAMKKAMDLELGNASSLHSAGTRARDLLEESREKVARLINADPSEIIFTSGGSESNNTVMHIFAGRPIAVSAIEHPSVLESALEYASRLTKIPVDNSGLIDQNFLKNLFGPELVSVMLANNELGTIEPIITSDKYKFHTDATQALGKIEIDVKKLGVDYLTASAHKIGGPVGVGLLYVKKGSPFRPLILGGAQEHHRRAGTTPLINIIGFAAAAEVVFKNKTWETYENRIRPLKNRLAKRILQEIPHSSLNSPLGNSLPNILNVSFAAAEGESIQLYLDTMGNIEVSTGSACASSDATPSHVLMATKNDVEIAHSSIRFSFGLDAKESDVDKVMEILPDIIHRLQGISTIKIKE